MKREVLSRNPKALSDTSQANIGFVLSHEQFPVTDLVEFAVAAEAAGFQSLSTSDHFQPWQSNQGHAGFAWVTLAAVGQRTRHLPFGTAVTCPSFRYNPAIVAEAFASLGILYPGRVFLGVGTGEALNEEASGGGWADYQARAARIEEAIGLIRKLWTGETITHSGKYFRVNRAKLYDVPSMPVPIYMAAEGPHSAELAGRIAGGLISDDKSAVKPEMRQAFEKGARSAGKDPATMPIIAEHWVCVGDDPEARKGAELWRFIPKAWTEFVQDPDPVDIKTRAGAEVPMDEVLKSFTIGQDADIQVEAIQKLVDAGVTTVLVHSAQEDQRMVIDWFGKNVLPRVQRRGVVATTRA